MACVDIVKQNLGLSNCKEWPSNIAGMIETNSDFSIPAATVLLGSAAVQTYLENALLSAVASRIYKWPPFTNVDDISQEAVYNDTVLAYTAVRDGNYRFRFSIGQNMCLHKAMYTHRRKNGRVFLIDSTGYLIGTQLSNGDLAGLSIQLLHTEKLKFNDGSVESTSPILVAMSSNIDIDKNGVMFDASAFINELESIVDVDLTVVGTPTATSIVVDVKTVCDDTPVSGLVLADFIKYTTLGATQSITSVTESATVPGRYSLVGSGWTTGTLALRSAALLTIKSYEAVAAVVITI